MILKLLMFSLTQLRFQIITSKLVSCWNILRWNRNNSRPIGIVTTNVPGIGNTEYVPHQVYAVKVDDKRIRLQHPEKASEDLTPEVLDFTTVGFGATVSPQLI